MPKPLDPNRSGVLSLRNLTQLADGSWRFDLSWSTAAGLVYGLGWRIMKDKRLIPPCVRIGNGWIPVMKVDVNVRKQIRNLAFKVIARKEKTI